MLQYPREHRRGRRLAVRARDGDQLASGGDLPERLGATNHRHASLARPRQLRMVLRHRRRDD